MGYSPAFADLPWLVHALLGGPDPVAVCDWVLEHAVDDDVRGVADMLKTLHLTPVNPRSGVERVADAIQELAATEQTISVRRTETTDGGPTVEVVLDSTTVRV